jgi:hypothetical protein
MGVVLIGAVVLVLVAFVGWLGGGRKWAFRTVLGALLIAALGMVGVFGYLYWIKQTTDRRTEKIRSCAIAKLATAKCGPERIVVDGKETDWEICPEYMLFDNPTPQDEENALEAARQACIEEMEPGTKTKTVSEEVTEYKRQHGIKDEPKKEFTDKPIEKNAVPWEKSRVLNSTECAARVRRAYPGAYDDLENEALTRKVLAKYPDYCSAKLP